MPDRSPIDMADEILAWVENCRPSDYPPWRRDEVRDLGILIAGWRAEQMADVVSTESLDLMTSQRDEVIAERDALRQSEQHVKRTLVSTFAAAIAGLADGCVIKQREYGFEDVAGAVGQLGEYAKGLEGERDALRACLQRLADARDVSELEYDAALAAAREMLASHKEQS